MASTSTLTIYTKATPVPYGPLTLASYIEEASGTEGVVAVQYAEKATEPTETCRLESAGWVWKRPDEVSFMLQGHADH